MTIYIINYGGHEEQCIVADNRTGTGGTDYHLVTLGGGNETIFNCDSWDEMMMFIGKHNGVKKEVELIPLIGAYFASSIQASHKRSRDGSPSSSISVIRQTS